MIRFKIAHKDKLTDARIGILKTKSGKIETPFFMPVATKAVVKFINNSRLEELKTKAVISNALILSIRPGSETIKKLGGIKKFTSFRGINTTDSGGFQMYSDSIYLKSNDKGVFFKNPVSGEKIFMTPEDNMKIQIDIDSDIAMCLDRMPLYKDSKEDIRKAVELTTRWASRCKESHDKLQKKISETKKQLLFCIVQGGVYKDLRKKSAQELVKIKFDGYAIGGLALPESLYDGEMKKAKKLEYQAIKIFKSIIPENKPCYLMGEGNPLEILKAISMGIDMLDSRMPTQSARRGTIYTSKGKLKILNKKYKTDKRPLDKKCSCSSCKTYSRAYIHHLLKEDEPVGKELASVHNIYYIQNLISEAKKEIKKNKFKRFIKKIEKIYKISLSRPKS